MKVKNMTGRTGREVANQFIIEGYQDIAGLKVYCKYFQSYNSTIVRISYGEKPLTMLDAKYWDYSRTTGKYRNQFLGETKKETQAKIDSGEYILTDLNGGN